MQQSQSPVHVVPQAELFAHGADIGVRGIGPSRAAAFEQAALALTMAVTDPATVAPQQAVEVTCEAPDDRFHNERSRLLLEISARLQPSSDDPARAALIGRLRRALEGG